MLRQHLNGPISPWPVLEFMPAFLSLLVSAFLFPFWPTWVAAPAPGCPESGSLTYFSPLLFLPLPPRLRIHTINNPGEEQPRTNNNRPKQPRRIRSATVKKETQPLTSPFPASPLSLPTRTDPGREFTSRGFYAGSGAGCGTGEETNDGMCVRASCFDYFWLVWHYTLLE